MSPIRTANVPVFTAAARLVSSSPSTPISWSRCFNVKTNGQLITFAMHPFVYRGVSLPVTFCLNGKLMVYLENQFVEAGTVYFALAVHPPS
ncbi:hypothetical protein NDU88_010931 [Pleurodeles waltl]|uniref:Uncharacterized protein n=1 Tax=Pleurodeles waltl TaxID=8319 RepID=A0AAV7R064_PLEWA|nr:hypothetical protein NDU88_010931 [Pleurodeles waltl]